MLRSLALSLCILFALPAPSAYAADEACGGQDLIAGLSLEDRTALDAAVAKVPFASGNHWRATNGDSTLAIIGTFHLFDSRMKAHLENLMPTLRKADAIYLEATDTEIAALKKAIASQPDLMFTNGATLPERLDEAEWLQLSQEMTARGIPAFLAAKFQPWYVSVMLAMPPCAMPSMSDGPSGMDHLIMEVAKTLGTRMYPLEPYDTVFRIFEKIPAADQLEMIRLSLPMARNAEDMLATMSASYDREDHRQIWEYSRLQSIVSSGEDPAKADAEFAKMEETMINARNRAWLDKILKAAPGKNLVIAVGAGHLAGTEGLLNLLQSAGYKLVRAEF